jgi:hypothetical protein
MESGTRTNLCDFLSRSGLPLLSLTVFFVCQSQRDFDSNPVLPFGLLKTRGPAERRRRDGRKVDIRFNCTIDAENKDRLTCIHTTRCAVGLIYNPTMQGGQNCECDA